MNYKYPLPDGRIVEFKTSPESRYIAVRTVSDAIRALNPLWTNNGKPPGYIFIFPVNEVAGEAQEVLETFKNENQDVEILWFDCHAFENILDSIGLNSEESIISFVEENKDAMNILERARKRSQKE
ncbi:hypothetical protein H6G00_15535 [Leptolyngbya sp. FACHB-541]|uniref:hypothetical protein n=1 Tax=Leptolyngbya sp. FACHB-541 TaxID=2692810 RepID=UPI00168945EA|nr:hypothetical protein [Leptolyngbya sp. FACHB-541]MBD1998024.1 hypothetical protein [Leptolyngbya sp. FACHB-541]